LVELGGGLKYLCSVYILWWVDQVGDQKAKKLMYVYDSFLGTIVKT